MTVTLIMTFNLENGKTTNLSLFSPRADLTPEEVNEVAHAIVAKNIFSLHGLKIVSLKRAYIRTVEEKEIGEE